MKNGGSRAFLTELVVVVLFFALAAVVSLRIFAYSNAKSVESLNTNLAVAELQETAEEFRRYGFESLNSDNGWQKSDKDYIKETKEFKIIASCTIIESDFGKIEKAVITITENKNNGKEVLKTSISCYIQNEYEVKS